MNPGSLHRAACLGESLVYQRQCTADLRFPEHTHAACLPVTVASPNTCVLNSVAHVPGDAACMLAALQLGSRFSLDGMQGCVLLAWRHSRRSRPGWKCRETLPDLPLHQAATC